MVSKPIIPVGRKIIAASVANEVNKTGGAMSAMRSKFLSMARFPLIGQPSVSMTRMPHAHLPMVRPLKYVSENGAVEPADQKVKDESGSQHD